MRARKVCAGGHWALGSAIRTEACLDACVRLKFEVSLFVPKEDAKRHIV